MRTLLPCLLLVALLVLPGCQMNERLSGTLFGAVGGGVVGGLAGGVVGAAIGVGAGGVAGYLVGDYVADQRERGRPGVFSDPQGAQGVMGVKVAAPPPADDARSAYELGRKALTAPVARQHFERSIRLDPTRPEPYNALGLNALYRGDRAEAERLFRASLAQDPGYGPARHNLARLTGSAAR
jgi:hypothetical protein